LQRKPERKRRGPSSEVINKANYRDHVWSYDFAEDRTESGNKLRFLVVVDEYTRECLAIEVERSMGAREVLECLEWLFLVRGVPPVHSQR
jgi:putative transposase